MNVSTRFSSLGIESGPKDMLVESEPEESTREWWEGSSVGGDHAAVGSTSPLVLSEGCFRGRWWVGEKKNEEVSESLSDASHLTFLHSFITQRT